MGWHTEKVTTTTMTTDNNKAQTWAKKREYTRGADAYGGYVLAGAKGIAFCASKLLAPATSWPDTLSVVPNGVTLPEGSIGAVLTLNKVVTCGRYNYSLAGCAGVLQVDASFFAGDTAPATLAVVGVTFATVAGNAARRAALGAAVTSAVVAAANVAQASAKAEPVAVPAVVAAVVAQAAEVLVARAGKAGKAGKAAQGAHKARTA